jgi:hypothetical protein
MGFSDPKPKSGTKLTRDAYRVFCSNLRQEAGPLDTPCLVWTGARHSQGYGLFRRRRAHIVWWEHHYGPTPKGNVLAHECNNKLCVTHVRPRTQKQNMQEYSGQEPNTHCPKCGTEFTPENTYTPPGRPYDRRCKKCRAEARKEVSRSNMGPAVTIRRAGRGLVVSVMPAEARRYELWSEDGEGNRRLEAAMDVPKDGERDPRNGTTEGDTA